MHSLSTPYPRNHVTQNVSLPQLTPLTPHPRTLSFTPRPPILPSELLYATPSQPFNTETENVTMATIDERLVELTKN